MLAAFLLLAHLPACYSWRAGNVEPAALLDRDHPDRVRVTRTDSSHIVLAEAHTRGDSLVGYSDGDRVALPLAAVAGLAERKGDLGKSLALGIGIPAVMLGILYVGACTGSGFKPC